MHRNSLVLASCAAFTASSAVSAQEATVTLLTPNGGETIVAGQPYQITWQSANLEQELPFWQAPYFYLTKGSDLNSYTIQYSYFAGKEVSWWVCPYFPAGDDYRLHISIPDGDRLIEDVSDAPFTITGSRPYPTFAITSPLAGSIVQAGEPLTVNWTSTATDGYVNLDLYKGGVYCASFGSSSPPTETITETLCKYLEDGADYTLRLSWGSCGDQVTASSEEFAIVGQQPRPVVTVTSPVAGEVWRAGTKHTIRWESTNPEGWVLVTVRPDELHAPVQTLTASMADGQVQWDICPYLEPGDQYQIEVDWSNCRFGGHALSAGRFSISPGCPRPSIQVLSPVGGEQWPGGTRQFIRWSAENAAGWANVALYKAGQYVQTLGNVPLADGQMAWDICSIGGDGNDYTVGVEWGECGSGWVLATSPSPFSLLGLQPEPQVQLLSPSAGDIFAAGGHMAITWSSVNPSGDMFIQLLKGGLPFGFLGMVPMADGQFEWDLCLATPTGQDYSIALSWGSCAGATVAVSPEKFTIVGAPDNPPMPTLELVRPVGDEYWTAGTTETVTWTSTNPVGDVRVYLEDPDGEPLRLLGRAPLEAGSFDWQIPTGLRSKQYLIQLYSDCGPGASSGWFTILPSPAAPAADLDGNCVVDNADFQIFRACVTGPGIPYGPMTRPRCTLVFDAQGHIAADFDRDGDVDQEDFSVLQRSYN